NAADVAVLERKANSISPTVAHLRNCLLVCSPCRRIASRRIATWVINTPWRLRPLLSVPEPAPAQPHFLGAQMRERRRQLGDVAVIGLRLRCCAIAHDEFLTKAATEPSCTVAEFASEVDLIVEVVLQRGLGDDWLDAEAVDRLACVLRADSVDLDLA